MNKVEIYHELNYFIFLAISYKCSEFPGLENKPVNKRYKYLFIYLFENCGT